MARGGGDSGGGSGDIDVDCWPRTCMWTWRYTYEDGAE